MKKKTSLTLEKFDCEASRSSLERLDLRDETLNSSLKQDASASDVTCVLGLPSKVKHKHIDGHNEGEEGNHQPVACVLRSDTLFRLSEDHHLHKLLWNRVDTTTKGKPSQGKGEKRKCVFV